VEDAFLVVTVRGIMSCKFSDVWLSFGNGLWWLYDFWGMGWLPGAHADSAASLLLALYKAHDIAKLGSSSCWRDLRMPVWLWTGTQIMTIRVSPAT